MQRPFKCYIRGRKVLEGERHGVREAFGIVLRYEVRAGIVVALPNSLSAPPSPFLLPTLSSSFTQRKIIKLRWLQSGLAIKCN